MKTIKQKLKNYYREALEKIRNSEERIVVKFENHNGLVSTQWLSLNEASAQEIIRLLRSKFNVL